MIRCCSGSWPATRLLAALLLPLAVISPLAWASESRPVRIRNNTSPGVLTRHLLTVTVTRTSRYRDYTEVVRYEQPGRLTQLTLDSSGDGTTQRAWMIELDEVKVLSLTRDGSDVADWPSAARLGLPPSGVALNVGSVSYLDGNVFVPGGAPVQRAALRMALDIAHWPKGPLRAGDTWDSPVGIDEGVRHSQLDRVEGGAGNLTAVIRATAEGQAAGSADRTAVIESGESECWWRLGDRTLVDLRSTVAVAYGPERDRRTMTLEANLALVERSRVPRRERKAAANEIAKLSECIAAYEGGDRERAGKLLAAFKSEHAKSLWQPLADDLSRQIRFEREKLEGLGDERLRRVLVDLVTRWQKTAFEDAHERLAPLRAAFAGLVKTNREGLVGLVRGEGANYRAMAVFCLAFGPDPADRAVVVSACADEHPRVRAWAVYGLAERGDADTDPDLLARVLGDEDAKVRQRACMAVMGCTGLRSPHRDRFADLLIRTIRDDVNDDVRWEAAGALRRLATRKHLKTLVELEAAEDIPPVERALKAIIHELGGKTRDEMD